jgi:hypothetical protein
MYDARKNSDHQQFLLRTMGSSSLVLASGDVTVVPVVDPVAYAGAPEVPVWQQPNAGIYRGICCTVLSLPAKFINQAS